MPFVKDEDETVLWEGAASMTGRMKSVGVLALILIAVGGVFFSQGWRVGLAVAIGCVWFLLPSLLYPVSRGSRYFVTNRRVVREKFPVLQQLELREIRRVRSPLIGFGLLGLWTLYFYPKEPLLTYYIVFSCLKRGEPKMVKRLVEEAMQGFATG